MSEYQYYEFLALDRPLSAAEQQALRAISSRAEISATRFANEYNYGDLRADPLSLLTRYFDAMVYVANWGTRRFLLRLPLELVDTAYLEVCCAGDSARLRPAGEHVILDLCSHTEEPEGWEEGEGWMGALASLRAELLRGDGRVPYLGWLRCAQDEELPHDTREPPVPPGLRELSAPLNSLIEFLRLDTDLLSVAAEHSGVPERLPAGMAEWIAALPETEKDALLLAVIERGDAAVGARLLRRYRALGRPGPAATPRTAGELLCAAHRCREERIREEARRGAEARARRQAEEAAARGRYLDTLAPRQEAVWEEVEQLVASKQAKAYDRAVGLLKDLAELATRARAEAVFNARLQRLRERHSRKPGFLGRLRRNGRDLPA